MPGRGRGSEEFPDERKRREREREGEVILDSLWKGSNHTTTSSKGGFPSEYKDTFDRWRLLVRSCRFRTWAAVDLAESERLLVDGLLLPQRLRPPQRARLHLMGRYLLDLDSSLTMKFRF